MPSNSVVRGSTFYRMPPFRHLGFMTVTLLVFLDAIQLAVLLVRRWSELSIYVDILLALGMLCLFLFWCFVLGIHSRLHQLLDKEAFDGHEQPLGINRGLSIASDIAIGGLFIFGIALAMLLRAAFLLTHPS